MSVKSIEVQLQMFVQTYHPKSFTEVYQLFREILPEVRALFAGVEQLLRLMLLCPLSYCSAERSFSALRRLKIWLRSTMTERRLNAVTVCHVNQEMLDDLDMKEIASEFCSRSDIRKALFGSFNS